MTLAVALFVLAQQPHFPMEFGKREINRVLGARASDVQLFV